MGRTVQKTNLLGDDDGGDMAMGGSTALSRARARRNGTPQHEYPIFTPVSFMPPSPPVQICSVIRVPRLSARDTNSSIPNRRGREFFI
jgi:hypothetical protein